MVSGGFTTISPVVELVCGTMVGMGRMCLWLMFLGCVIGLLTAALFEGLTGPGSGGYIVSGDYTVIGSFTGGGTSVSESTRYAVIAAVGAVVGALGGGVLHLTGAQVQPLHRVGLTMAVGLAACAVGVLPAMIAAATVADLPGWFHPLMLYAITGAVGYGLAITAVYVTLRMAGDQAARSTARITALVLPVGTVVATTAGVGSAWVLGFSTVTSTWVVATTLAILILSATFAVARAISLRQHQPQ